MGVDRSPLSNVIPEGGGSTPGDYGTDGASRMFAWVPACAGMTLQFVGARGLRMGRSPNDKQTLAPEAAVDRLEAIYAGSCAALGRALDRYLATRKPPT